MATKKERYFEKVGIEWDFCRIIDKEEYNLLLWITLIAIIIFATIIGFMVNFGSFQKDWLNYWFEITGCLSMVTTGFVSIAGLLTLIFGRPKKHKIYKEVKRK